MSLTSKVLWIFVGALIVVGALAWGFSKPWRGPWRDQLPKAAWINLRAHLINVANQISSSPSERDTRKLLRELRLEAMVRDGDTTIMRFGDDLPDWQELEKEVEQEERRWAKKPNSLRSRLGDFVVGRADGRMFGVVVKENRTYAFFIEERDGFQGGLRAFSGFAFTIAFLLIVILGLTSWLVRPMKPLIKGVNAISAGRLDYRFPTDAKGEFGRLGEAFNKMAARIQEQLSSKDQLLMDVSHELRSPLGRIKMATEMLQDEKLKPQLKSDIQEMEELITVLLDLYRQQGESTKVSEVTFDSLLRGALGPVSETKPGINYDIKDGDARLVVDDKAIVRALRNVVENALKFSAHQNRPVEVTAYKSASRFIIDVKDFGIGISEAEKEKVFEMFYRADSSRVRSTGGYGLGLSIARAALKAAGGNLEIVATSPGNGSTFRMTIPASNPRSGDVQNLKS